MSNSPLPRIDVYPDRAALSRAAADQFVKDGDEAIAERGAFTVALSGGTTPRETYEELASADLGRVNWNRVFFFWGDERAVPPDNPESNFRMANEVLLSRVPVPPENVYRIHSEKPASVAAMEYEQQLARFWGNTLKGFDLVFLGLGTNGHTASLFPQTSALEETSRWCVAVWVPELNAERITLTAEVLNHSANVIFLVSGKDKATVVRQVLRGPYDPQRLPAQLIQPKSGTLRWLLDQEAASEL